MGFDVTYGFRRHTRNGEGLGRGFRLTVDAGREIARLLRAVVIDGGTDQHRLDIVAIGKRILEPPQDDERRAGAEHRALTVIIKRAAEAVGRLDLPFNEFIAMAMRQFDGDAAGNRHVALHGEQAGRRLMHGDERGRAGGLDRHRRPLQIQQIGQPRRQEILVITGMAQKEHADFRDKVGIGQQVERKIGLHAGAGKDADPPIETFGHMAGILQRLPGAFKEMAVLRIEDGGFARRKAEKARIETFHIGKVIRRAHIVRVGQLCRA